MGIKLIIAGVAAVAAVGGGTYFVVNNTGDNDVNRTSQQVEKPSKQEPKETLTKASLDELLARGDNLECSFSYIDDSNNKTSGTFYIAKERMRGDFSHKPGDGESAKYGMIRRSSTVYTWDKAKNEGFKIDISDYEKEAEKTQEELKQQAIDQSKKYDFECRDWNADESKFETPQGVKFSDLSAQLDKIKQQNPGAAEQIQNACAQLADPQVREACEKNL